MRFTITHTTESVGPAHDPYHRGIYTFYHSGRRVSHVSCALAGEWVEVNGKRIAFPSDSSMSKYDAAFLFHLLTGMTIDAVVELYQWHYQPDPMGSLSDYA